MEKEISLKGVMLRSSSLMIVALGLGKVLGYLFHFVFVKTFSQEDYGSFVYAWSMALFLCGLLIPNIAASVTRYVAYFRGKSDEQKVSSAVRTGIILNTLLILPAAALSYILYAAGLLRMDAVSYAFVLSIMALNAIACLFSGIISGYRKPEVSALLNLVQQGLRVAAIVAAALLAGSLHGIFSLVAFAFLIYALVVVAYERRRYGFGLRWDGTLAKQMFTFGVFTVFYVTANNILAWFDIFMIKYFMTDADVAVYNAAWLASTLNLVFFTSVLQIFSPVAAELFGAGKRERLVKLTAYVLETFFLLFLPIFMSTFLFAREILTFFFKAEYAVGASALQVLSIGGFFTGISLLFIELISAQGKPKLNALNIGAGAALNALLNLIMIPAYGILGAAFSTLVSSSVILALSYLQVKGIVRSSFSARRILKIVFSSSVAVAAVYVVKVLVAQSLLSLIISCVALVSVYCILLLLLKGLRQEDVDLAQVAMEKAYVPAGMVKLAAQVLKSAVNR